MEAWRKVWRDGIVPQLTVAHLESLQRGLSDNDERLLQGCTTCPPPLQLVMDWPCEGSCLVAYGQWQAEGLKTVGDVEECFANVCFQADQLLGQPAAVRYLLNWFDDTPRDEMRQALLGEVKLALEGKRQCQR